MKQKLREQILTRHNKLVDSGRTAWTTEERDRCRLLDYVAQLEEVPCSHCFDKIAQLEEKNESLRKLAHDYIRAYEKLAFADALLEGQE